MRILNNNWNEIGQTITTKTCENVPQLETNQRMEQQCDPPLVDVDISLNSVVRPSPKRKFETVPPFDADGLQRVYEKRIIRQEEPQRTDDMSLWGSIRRQVETLSKPLEETINRHVPPAHSQIWGWLKPEESSVCDSTTKDENSIPDSLQLAGSDTPTPGQSPVFQTARSYKPSPTIDLSRVPTNETLGFKHLNESAEVTSHLSSKEAMTDDQVQVQTQHTDHQPDIPYGFSFSPAGLLLPYHLGVLDYLIHSGMIHENTPLAGASAGAIAALIGGLQRNVRELIPHLYKLEANLRLKGTGQRLAKEVKSILEEVILDDDHEKLSVRAQPAAVIYTTIMPWKGQVVRNFTSKSDLIQCLLASCNIPFYFQRSPTVKCRGYHCVDGYFSDRKNFGCPKMPNVKTQVRILPFSAATVLPHLSPHEYISPDLSIFDNNIPQEDYDTFMQHMRDFPAPLPTTTTSKTPSDEIEPPPVLAFSQKQGNNPISSHSNDSTLTNNDSRNADESENDNDKYPSLEIQNTHTSGASSDDGTKILASNCAEGRVINVISPESEGIGQVKSTSWDSNTAEPHIMMITRTMSNILSEGKPKSRHSSMSRKGRNLFRSNMSRDVEALNVQTPHHYPLVTTGPHQNNHFLLSQRNNSSEKKGIIRRLLRRKSKDRIENKTECELIDKSSRSESPGKSGDEADGETEKTAWSFWGLGQKGFMSAWMASISDERNDDNNHCSKRTGAQKYPTQITSYSLLQKPRRPSLLRRRRAPVPEPKYPGLPIPRFGWRTLLHYALNPTNDDEEVRELYNLGRADAFRWVQLNKKRTQKEA